MPQVKRKLSGRNKAIKRKCSSYSIGQKEQVVTYAKYKRHGRNKAAKHFKLDVWLEVGLSKVGQVKLREIAKALVLVRTASYPEGYMIGLLRKGNKD
jgi:hypothetical protein